MGCGGHQYGYPTSIKSYYESINILSVMKVQYDELVAGGLVPVATPVFDGAKESDVNDALEGETMFRRVG